MKEVSCRTGNPTRGRLRSLRSALTGGSAATKWSRTDVVGRRHGQAFLVVSVWNRTMCHPGMAEGHGVTAGGEPEMADRLAARSGLSKTAARDAVDGVFAIIAETLADGDNVRLPGFGTF